MIRRRTIMHTMVSVLAVPFLSACASWFPSDVVEPQDVTVSEALKDIGKGFADLDAELRDKVLGVYPCKITVSLDVKASAKDAGKVVVDLSTKPRVVETTPLDPAAKANIERSGEAAAERGNTVEILMYNPACLPNNTLGYDKPDSLNKAMEGMAVTENDAERFKNIQKIRKKDPSKRK